MNVQLFCGNTDVERQDHLRRQQIDGNIGNYLIVSLRFIFLNIMIDLLTHTEYQRWANRKTAESLRKLSPEKMNQEFGGSFPSIRLTVLHLLQADYRWLHRLNGNPIVEVPVSWQTAESEFLVTRWLEVQDELVARVKELQIQPDPIIKFTTAKGDTYELPLRDVIAHLVNHATYHRGQVVNMLRMAGEKPEGTDYFLFVVEQRAKARL